MWCGSAIFIPTISLTCFLYHKNMPERPPTETQEEIDPNDVEEVIEENVAVPGETPNQKPYLVENNRVRKGKNVLVGRFEIAYNQFWIDRHQKQTVEIKNKID